MEAPATRRVLERLPEEHYAFTPADKSWSLGHLAMHVAQLQGNIAGLVTPDVIDGPPQFKQGAAASRTELLQAFDDSLAKAKAYLAGLTDEQLNATWAMNVGGKQIMAMPRSVMVRMIMCNHLYHHRGQLLVYLRLLGVPVPSVYGPTADENPFAA